MQVVMIYEHVATLGFESGSLKFSIRSLKYTDAVQ
jgi:hypothetical protein